MIISTKGRYSLRVIIDIAENSQGRFISLKDICARQALSEKYTEAILAPLTKAGLLDSAGGKGGGFRLVKAPEEYTVYEIIQCADKSLAAVSCLEDGAAQCCRRDSCKTLPLWEELTELVRDHLKSITLDDLLDGGRLSGFNKR